MANLRIRTWPQFPTLVQGTDGISVTKENGRYVLAADWTTLPDSFPSVRYDDDQSLDDTQREQARDNIGAVAYDEQTLTDNQKEQARDNIDIWTQAGADAVVRTSVAKLREQLRSSDDHTSLLAAITESNTDGVLIPEGEISSADEIVAPDGQSIVLYGRGPGSILTKEAGGGAGPYWMMQGKTRLHLENLAFVIEEDTGATNTTNLFRHNHDNIVLDNVTADGNVIIDPDTGARNHHANLSTIEAGTRSGLTIKYSSFTNFFYGFLKTSTTVSTESDISILFNSFDDFGSVALLFNSPATGSLIENVQIIGNKLGANRSRQPFGSSVGFPHRGSFAGNVEYARLIGNHATGYGGELFRAEESARGVIMALNTARLDGADGIEIIPNNVGGTVATPRFFNVSNNILDHRGIVSASGKGWGLGLQTYTSELGLADAECLHDSTVHDNIIFDFSEGLRTHYGMQRNLVHHNVAADHLYGIRTWAPSLGTVDNLLVENTTAVRFESGGILGRVHLRGTAAAGTYHTFGIVDAPGAVEGWTWESGRFTLADGSTYVELLRRGTRMEGKITASLSINSSNYSFEHGHLSWDGTTLTYYRERRFTTGSVVISSTTPFGLSSADGRLAIHLSSSAGTDTDNCRLQVKFDGLFVWS